MNRETRLKEIEQQYAEHGIFNADVTAEGIHFKEIDWLISELKSALEREKIATKALKYYCTKHQWPTRDYDMELMGKKAADALSEIERLREGK